MQYKVIQVGFGSLGMEIYRVLCRRKNFKIVGVVDIDEKKVGKNAGVLAINKRSGIIIAKSIDELRTKPDLAIHATTSSLKDVYHQITELLRHKINVLSTCEELVYPTDVNMRIAKILDLSARKHDARVLGVGVNPGFVMDSLVLMLSSLCTKIDRIRIERVVDVAKRRKALQEKMCVGVTRKQFNRMRRKVGHVGLLESVSMICGSLGVRTDNFTSFVRPIVANRRMKSNGVTVESGYVSGIEHILIVRRGASKFIEMRLKMFVGANEFDSVEIDGRPPIRVKTNGINGDQATIALILNYIPIILEAGPGLHTVNNLPLPSAS
jgi:4-hydroxy-tetrahydrodipicolinate reductase